MSVEKIGGNWALELFRESLRTSRLPDPGDVSAFFDDDADKHFEKLPLNPERLQYLRELIQYILDGREVVYTYNMILLVVLVLFSLLHLRERLRERAKARAIEQDSAESSESRGGAANDSETATEVESSASSTVEGSVSSQSTIKAVDTDVELLPLLGSRRRARALKSCSTRLANRLSAVLMYQPRPIPFINRALPSNGTSLVVLAFLGLNVFLQFYQVPFETRFFFAFADRIGLLFAVNLPLLYLLAAKNQPVKLLTGCSYEALNIYHRRVGELMCFQAVVHFVGMLFWRLHFSPAWLQTADFYSYMTHPLILEGIGAFVAYETLYFTSLGSFRQRWYEIFLASHIVLQVAALVFLYLHFFTARPFVLICLTIFLADRAIWRLWMKSASFTADLTILEDGNTLLVSADWDIPDTHPRKCWDLLRQSIRYGWRPADHVFVSVPALGRTHSLQAHPFTIASAAPEEASKDVPSHAWLSLLVRVQGGFTADLLAYARAHARVPVRLDGPYGSQDPVSMLRSCGNAVLVAGGSGIAVVFPMAWALAANHRSHRRRVHLMWVLQSRAQRSWIPEDRLADLRRLGVHVTVPRPTIEAGRPDIPGYIADLTAAAGGTVGFVVSGPDSLNRTARNACAEAVRTGADIRLLVEKFGW
ncbi:ferric reductase like transmembrane component-domain-containing protein [Durotheca rogersii]|uniref:ferric reductase like transmembrane component-domain-containing protein n=1 Tax=Durotheca rogersii TaxID=419775 RepID=UPI00221F0E0F|nr:ferric reductase like transmembrane component-domain-containing protein [Durotheca rogersii]KAI5855102.1 ferric reductase like transmembrane component-domain-containing protein [Durotheca rogersii]